MKQKSRSAPAGSPPVNEGEEYAGFVDSVGEKGDGVVRIKGFVVFVPGVQKGDYIKLKVTKVLPKLSFGELVQKLEPPKSRAPAKEAFLPPSKKKDEPDPEIKQLLTTEGDSEDFGEDEDIEEE